jgi:pimeloyl-ACP methyl ester carboxylesterase
MPYLNRDGVKLYYEEAGSGEPPMLLVHGWTCNHTHWAAQVAHFAKTHRVVTVDLRGHGVSDAPNQEYTMEGFADDLAWLCAELGVEKPVVCGHSMGGIVTLVLAADHHDIVRAAVLVDSPFPPIQAGNQNRLAGVIEAFSKPDYLSYATTFIEGMFSPLDDPKRKAEIIAGMLATPHHVLFSAMKTNAATDSAAAGRRIEQPLLVISAGHMTFSDPSRLSTEFPQMHYAQTFGSGHFNMIEVPEQVNAMIERFLATDVV